MSFLIISIVLIFYKRVEAIPAGHTSQLSPSTLVIAPLNNLREVTNHKIAQLINSKAVPIVPPFPDSGRTRAVLEHEHPISQKDTIYQNFQQFAAGFYHPKPIVDTIQEHEKYGNDGGKSRSAAIGIIAGVEKFSNILNTAVEVPFEVFNQLGKKFTATAGAVGAKAVGL